MNLTGEADPADPRNWVGALGIVLTVEHGRRIGRAELRPDMWAPGTRRVRMGVLATMVDIVGGMPPTGALNPTVDLRVQLVGQPPETGVIELEGFTLKAGRRLYSGEVLVRAEGASTPFARGAVTFINQALPTTSLFDGPRRPRPADAGTFDDLLDARSTDARTVEVAALPRLRNGGVGTIQGGAQALAAEIAAERLLAAIGPHTTSDLDVRYLNPLVTGPLVARAEQVGDAPVVRVKLADGGADGKLVSTVLAVCQPLS